MYNNFKVVFWILIFTCNKAIELNLYNNSVTLFGHLCFVLGPIHLGLVPGWSTTEGESFDPGKVAILPTLENTTLTPTTARRSFAWLPNSLEHLSVFQTSPPCPFHVFTRLWFPDESNGKIEATKTSNTNSSLGFLPINFKLATTTSRLNLRVIRWFWSPSIRVHPWY